MIFQKELMKRLATHSDRIAIESGQEIISYAALIQSSNRITSFLLGQKLLPGSFVGIKLDDRSDIIASIIGIANARCVFVPLDSSLPDKRLAAMIEQLNLEHIILPGTNNGNSKSTVVNNYYLDDILAVEPAPIQFPEYEEDDSLYVYFTSGSTGVPKGIIGKNCSLLQFIEWEISALGIDENSRFSQFINPYFDAFLRDVFVPLFTGATICIPPPGKEFFTPEKLVAWINETKITLIHCVPSLFRMFNNDSLTPDHFAHLKYILLSGEKIIPGELAGWYKLFGSRIQLVNLYGTTETTMIRSCYLITPEDVKSARIPIGSPIAATELIILDKELQTCNTLVAGDLYIVSRYVTKGYLNNPALTAEKFLTIEGFAQDGKIAFKTGDRARLLADGKIDLMGREDRQVKLRGIRVELDEIEKVLLQSEFVKEAVVIKHTGDNNNESLFAFVIRQNQFVDSAHLKESVQLHVKNHLPEYIALSNIIEISEYPLLSNGKIHYKELLNRIEVNPVIEPVNEVETRLLAIWKEILGDKVVSTADNFHAMGGNSLSIMRLIGKIYKEYNIRFSLGQLFDNLTISEQAAFIKRSGRDNYFVIPVAEVKPAYRLSLAQERIFFNYQLNKKSTAFNLPMAWEIKGGVDKNKIEETFHTLIKRHESFRTSFIARDKLVQVVQETVNFSIEEINSREENVQSSIDAFVRPFDLSKAPLLRAAIITTPGNKKILVTDMHHIVCDGMSQINLLSDFITIYNGADLAPLRIQYKDYAEWEYNFKMSEIYTADRGFWLKAFEGEIPKLVFPTINAGITATSQEGQSVAFKIDAAIIARIAENFKGENITVFSTLFSLFYMYLSQLSGQEDIVIGINAAGRLQDELQEVVGMFAKTLPIRYRMDANMRFRDFVKKVNHYLIEANSKQLYDLADIVSEINNSRKIPVQGLFDVMFVFQNFTVPPASRTGNTEFSSYEFANSTSKYPLTLFATENDRSFDFRLEYSSSYFTGADIQLLITQFQQLVNSISGNMNRTLGEYIDSDTDSVLLTEEAIDFKF